jgi:DNA-binding NtrC family response regulator
MSEHSFEIEALLADEPQSRSKIVNAALPIRDGCQPMEGIIAPLRKLRAQAEIQGIQSALNVTGWNRKQAARLLKISYRGLLYKIRQHNITRQVSESG